MRQKVFLLHAKTARWHHCNADKFKTLKAKYMLIRLLYAYRMTEYVGKISLRNSKLLLRKLQKNSAVILLLPHPVDIKYYV